MEVLWQKYCLANFPTKIMSRAGASNKPQWLLASILIRRCLADTKKKWGGGEKKEEKEEEKDFQTI